MGKQKDTEKREQETTPAPKPEEEIVVAQAPEVGSDEEFREEQLRGAREQNLKGSNAVPEQRPQSFMTLPDHMKSEVERSNPVPEPMPSEAFERAESEAQKAKAAKNSKKERLLLGQTVRIVNHPDDLMNGRKGVIVDIEFTEQGARDARSGDPVLHNYAEVEKYIVNTRDEGQHRVECTPDQVEVLNRFALSGRDTF